MTKAVWSGADIPANSWERRVLDRSLNKASQRSLDRASGLMDAAIRLMERTKGDSFSVQDVAAESGQSLRSFYQHFASRDDLFLAIFEKVMRVYAKLLNEAVDRYDDPLDRLVAGLASVSRLSRHSSQGLAVGVSHLKSRLTEASPQKVAEITGPVTDTLRRLASDAVAAGVVSDCDPDTFAFAVFSLASAMSQVHFLGNTFDLKLPDDAHFVRLFLYGVGAEPPPGWSTRFGLD